MFIFRWIIVSIYSSRGAFILFVIMRKVFMFRKPFIPFTFDWRVRVGIIRLTYRIFNINFVLAAWRDED